MKKLNFCVPRQSVLDGSEDFVVNISGLRELNETEAAAPTQEALAETADINRSNTSDIERGLRDPGINNVTRLAKSWPSLHQH